jgi:lysine 2,3-aminomutase
MPNYMVSMSDDAVILRNYEGMLVRYQATDEATDAARATSTRGVSGLLQGDRTQLVPEGNERLARRRKLSVVDPGYEVGCDGASEQPVREGRPIIPLPTYTNGNGVHAAAQ